MYTGSYKSALDDLLDSQTKEAGNQSVSASDIFNGPGIASASTTYGTGIKSINDLSPSYDASMDTGTGSSVRAAADSTGTGSLASLGDIAKGFKAAAIGGALTGDATFSGLTGTIGKALTAADSMNQQKYGNVELGVLSMLNPALAAVNAVDSFTGNNLSNAMSIATRDLVKAITGYDMFSQPAVNVTQGIATSNDDESLNTDSSGHSFGGIGGDPDGNGMTSHGMGSPDSHSPAGGEGDD